MRDRALLSAIVRMAMGLGSFAVFAHERQIGGVGLTIFADRNFRLTIAGDPGFVRRVRDTTGGPLCHELRRRLPYGVLECVSKRTLIVRVFAYFPLRRLRPEAP
jgi:hypothetical protein